MSVDIYRGTSGVDLPAQLSTEIWGDAVEASVVMQAARRISLPGSGVKVHVITGDPVAEWVDETDEKPVSTGSVDSLMIEPYKLAVIEPFSNEFRRDLGELYQELRRRLPYALALGFDRTVFGSLIKPGGNFDQLSDTSTSQNIGSGTALQDLVDAYQAVTMAGGDISAWIGGPRLAGHLIAANIGTGDFNLSSSMQVGSAFGAPVYRTRAGMPGSTIGYAGDFQRDAVWGSVEGIRISISDQATINDGSKDIHLWQRNMFAVLAEIEVGFRVTDVDRFVALDDPAAASS